MSETTTPPAADPALLAALERIGDAIFSHKNAVVAAMTANTAALNALAAHTSTAAALTIPMPTAAPAAA